MPHDARPSAMFITLTSRPVGIAMAADQGFEFVATDPDFKLLDGSSFRRLEQLEQAAQSLARVVRGSDGGELVAVPIPSTARGYRPLRCGGIAKYDDERKSIKLVDLMVYIG